MPIGDKNQEWNQQIVRDEQMQDKEEQKQTRIGKARHSERVDRRPSGAARAREMRNVYRSSDGTMKPLQITEVTIAEGLRNNH